MATEQQQYKLTGVLVEHQSKFRAFSNEDAQWVIQNPAEAIALWGDAIKNRAKAAVEGLLALVGSVVLPPTKRFVASEKFTKEKANVGWMGDNFKSWFLDKIEEAAPETNLSYRMLTKASLDDPIISELGGEEKCDTTLANIFTLIERQKTASGDGPLLVNGYANIFYVRDKDGKLRVVSAYWYAVYGYWYVNANPVDNPYGWNAGSRVFSRN